MGTESVGEHGDRDGRRYGLSLPLEKKKSYIDDHVILRVVSVCAMCRTSEHTGKKKFTKFAAFMYFG
jgi:hypothetical protein